MFNAAVASAAAGESVAASAKRITSHFNSVSVCFSKGLGAPVGSALCGSKELIARAHRIRKMAGGGMRQVGLLAAAASHALDHHLDRLADDHALAQRLAAGLQGIDGLHVRSAQTNIVFVDVDNGLGPDLLAYLKQHGVLATGLIGLRFVTHLDVDATGIDHAVACASVRFSPKAAPLCWPLPSRKPRAQPSTEGPGMPIDQLLLFMAAGWLLNLTPGPDVLYIVVTHALRSGARAGIVAALGITAGCFVHIVAAALGVSALMAASATAFTAAQVGRGGLYLMYVGLRLLLSAKPSAIFLEAGYAQPTGAAGLSDIKNVPANAFMTVFAKGFAGPMP